MSNTIISSTNLSAAAAPAGAYLASLGSEASRSAMRSRLQYAARLLGASDLTAVPWAELDAAKVAALLAQSEGAPSTRNLLLAALRGVARSAWRMGLMSSDTYARIVDVQKVNGRRLPAGRYVEPLERAQILGVAKHEGSRSSVRDACAMALAMGLGLRRAELCALRLEDILRDADGMITLRITGKRGKERTAYVQNGALRALRAWLGVRGAEPGYLLCRVLKNGTIQPALGLSPVALHKRLEIYTEQAELDEPVTWHDFRRTVATDLLEQGTDIAVAAALLGHESVRTTAQYDRRPENARAAAAAKVSVPF
jgi:integrase